MSTPLGDSSKQRAWRWPARVVLPSTPTSPARIPGVVERGSTLLHQSLDITSRLGGTHFTGALYSALGKYGRPLSEAGRRNVVTVLRQLAKEAQRSEMTLGLEICNRYET